MRDSPERYVDGTPRERVLDCDDGGHPGQQRGGRGGQQAPRGGEERRLGDEASRQRREAMSSPVTLAVTVIRRRPSFAQYDVMARPPSAFAVGWAGSTDCG